MTNRILLQYDRQIEELSQSVVFYFLKSKIEEFYKQNGIRIETLKGRVVFLQKAHFAFDGDKIKYEGKGKDMKPICLEGKTLDGFQEELNKIMNEETVIVL